MCFQLAEFSMGSDVFTSDHTSFETPAGSSKQQKPKVNTQTGGQRMGKQIAFCHYLFAQMNLYMT